MRVLAFDTSMAALSVAVHQSGEGLLAAHFEEMETGQAERLMPAIDNCLGAARLRLADIDRLIVTTGPGTFTGVRIGLSVARGLAVATGIPTVGISSLRAIAAATVKAPFASDPPLLCDAVLVAMAARGGALYAAVYDRAGRTLMEPALQQPSSLVAALDPAVSYLAVGSLAETIAIDARTAGIDIRAAEYRVIAPDARAFADLAGQLPVPTDPPSPLYLREPDAKPQVPLAIAGDVR